MNSDEPENIVTPAWREALKARPCESQQQQAGRVQAADNASMHARCFTESGSAIHALLAFLRAREGGVPIPEQVMAWLEQAITEYLTDPDRASLDQLLGLQKGRGQSPDATSYRRTAHLNGLMREIWQNTRMFRISAEQGIELVAARLEQDKSRVEDAVKGVASRPDAPATKPPRIEGIYTYDTLERYWYGSQGKFWRDLPSEYGTAGRDWADDQKRERAASYPPHVARPILGERK